VSHGLYFQANYTWAHNISDAQGDAPNGFTSETSCSPPPTINSTSGRRVEMWRGMPRQRFLLTGTYQLPFGPAEAGRAAAASSTRHSEAGNINTVTLIQTGPFLTPTVSPTLDHPIRHRRTGRHHCAAGRNRTESNTQSGGTLWDVNAFAPTPAGAGRIGNAGVGILPGPGTIAVSAGLFPRYFPFASGLASVSKRPSPTP